MDRRDLPNQSPVNAHSFFDSSPGHPNPVLRSPALSHERAPYGMHSLPSAFSMMGRRPGLSHPGPDYLSQDPILSSQANLSPPGPLHSGLGIGTAGPGWPWMPTHPHMTSPDYFSSHMSSGWLGGHEHDHSRDRVDDCLFPTPRSHAGLLNGVSSASNYAPGSGIFYPHPTSPTPQLHQYSHHSNSVPVSKSWSNHSNHNQRVTYDRSDNHDLDLFSPQLKTRHPSLTLSEDSCSVDIPSYLLEQEQKSEQEADKMGRGAHLESTGVFPGAHFTPKDLPLLPNIKHSIPLKLPQQTQPPKTSKPEATKPIISSPQFSNLDEMKGGSSQSNVTHLSEHRPPQPQAPTESQALPPPPKLTKTKAPPPPKLQVPKSILNDREVPKKVNAKGSSVHARDGPAKGEVPRSIHARDSPAKGEIPRSTPLITHRHSLLNSSKPTEKPKTVQASTHAHNPSLLNSPPEQPKPVPAMTPPERPSVLKQTVPRKQTVQRKQEKASAKSVVVATEKIKPSKISVPATVAAQKLPSPVVAKPKLVEPPKVPSGKPLAMARFRVPYNNEDTSDEESDSSDVSSASESGSGSDDESEEEAEGEAEGEEESSGSDSSSSDGEEGEEGEGEVEGAEEEEEEDDDDDDDEEKSGMTIATHEDGEGSQATGSVKRKLEAPDTGSPKRRRRVVDEDACKIPLDSGWKRQTRLRPAGAQGGLRGDVYYFGPCGKKLRTYPEVSRYLTRNNITNLTEEQFSFSTKLLIGEVLECKEGSTFELVGEEELKKRREIAETKRIASEKISKRRETKKQQLEMIKKAQETKLRKKMEKQMAAEQYKKAKQERAESRKMKKLERLQALQQAKQSKREQVRMHAEEKKRAKEQAKQQRKMAKLRRQEQLRMEKEMRALQAQEARRRKKEDVQSAKYEEAMFKVKDRELKRQQAILLKQQEREQKRQQQMMVRALETQRKADERERQKEEKRMEKKLIKERKLEQKRREMILARELKKPVEDMVLRDAKTLPELPRLNNCMLPGQAFADLLMVEEFIHNFGEALDIDPSTELPTLGDMQLSMICEGEDVLLPLCQLLLTQAMADPGCEGPYSVTKLGQALHKVELTDNNTCEILRLFILSRSGGFHELADALEEQPFQSLSPNQKGSVLSFLCNELLCSRLIIREIENSIEHMSNLRRDKWVVEGKIRKLKAIQAEKYPVVKVKKPPGRPRAVDTVEADNSRDASSIADGSVHGNDDEEEEEEEEEEEDDDDDDDDDDDGEGGGNGSGSSEESEEEEDDTEPQTQEDLERRLKKMEKKHTQFRSKLFSNSHSLRALSLGQDRYKRRFWVLPHTGGVLIEGMESAEKEGLLDAKEGGPVQGDRERVEKMDINIAMKEGSHRKRSSLPLKDTGIKVERGGISPLQSSMNGPSLSTPGASGASLQTQFTKLENLIKSATTASTSAGTSPSQNIVVSHVVPSNASNNWFSLLPRMPCDESSLTLSHTPLSGQFVPTYSKKTEIVLMNSPIPIKRPPGRPPKNAAQIVFQPNLASLIGTGSPLANLPGQHLLSSPASQTSDLSTCSTPEMQRGPCTSASSTPHMSTMSLSFEELKKNVLESLRREPAPIPPELQHGWWRLTEPSQIKELTKVLHCRGIREKILQKNFQKYSDYIALSCKKTFDEDEESDSDTDEEDGSGEKSKKSYSPAEDTWFPASEFAVNKAMLKEVEEMEEKVFAASLQIKGWKLPAKVTRGMIYNSDMAADSEDNPLSIAVTRLAALELGLERRYLKPPFRDDKVQIPTNIGTALAPGEVPSADGTPHTDPSQKTSPASKLGPNITHALKVWRTAVSSATNASQLAMGMTTLVKSIAWEKSIMKVFCQMCRKGDNEELLLLCDGCDRGYHTYCCTPKMQTIPEGDWYCMDCIVLAAGGDNCCVCGGPSGKMAKCDNCPRNFHLQCLEPPLMKLPRSSWTCPKCKKRRAKNPTPRRKKEKKKQEEEAQMDYELELEQDTDDSSKTQEIRHHVNRKQSSKDMAPCRVLLADMEKHEDAWPFLVPVNAKQFPEYYKIIRKPMDFHTMKIKLRDYLYTCPEEFVEDSRLVFANCEEFNEDDSEVGQAGKRLSRFFEAQWSECNSI